MTMWELFEAACEPPHPHCAHLFENDGKRGAGGKWCPNTPWKGGPLCWHHNPTTEWTRQKVKRQTSRERHAYPPVFSFQDTAMLRLFFDLFPEVLS